MLTGLDQRQSSSEQWNMILISQICPKNEPKFFQYILQITTSLFIQYVNEWSWLTKSPFKQNIFKQELKQQTNNWIRFRYEILAYILVSFYIFRCWSLVFYLYEGGLQADVGHQSEELQCLCSSRLLWGSQQKHSGHLNSAGVPAGNGRFVLRTIFCVFSALYKTLVISQSFTTT